MKRVCIVQARMRSTRLPGKVLRDLLGRPMLVRQIERLATCRSIDEVVIATTTHGSDDAIAAAAAEAGVAAFRGPEEDVVARFVTAAQAVSADVVVRVTADCPLIDPGTTDLVIDELTGNTGRCDYASNVVRRTFPRGLDVEALFIDTLWRVDRLAQTPAEREHVTVRIRSDPSGLFLVRSVEDAIDNADLRWTVDEEQDFALVERLFDELDLARTILPYREILAHVRAHPDLAHMNRDVETWDPSSPSGRAVTKRGAR